MVIILGFSAVTAAMWAHAIGGIVVAVLAEGSTCFSAFVQCEQARVSEPVLFCPAGATFRSNTPARDVNALPSRWV
ncbi:SPW repeat protein [Rhizobium lentis]|uniref:H+/Cl- antiporter ClcA n=1 Tax=Rhizobium lentis TaxID=1138194 RepID=A0A7W8UL75_9HYPH|nr:SPW repeat protein [Rhizobium lentis]MBB4573998.1 H+/Cl- antiporter ClcA [Rhizobium lentis]MBB5549926.1 H+/Cl- antiporter ClcA [Rhizobium lentis]MBB5560066.1 H+/Cl- antiporter ClcA [Rhizobium lentis]MBB5567046.1 H+/Cl- antiporter ClcA [Rhizobium lentis]